MLILTAPWLKLSVLQNLFVLFDEKGATLRLVGGSVRDGLLGLPVNDIDLAVDRDPYWVMEVLRNAHIKVIPTGIGHGTVTAIMDKRPYQITTLRVDVKTFGRRAYVAFTDDWTQDALRRDFTMNAIYADRNGHLFDPVGGIDDLQNKRLRFIGNPAQRIKEDYLRILRFFRFSARFGHEPYDQEGLIACKTYASHLPYLAKERVTDEFLKLLQLPSPLYTLDAMDETNTLGYILHPGTWEELKVVIALEKICHIVPSAIVRLSAFHPSINEIRNRLRLSKKQEAIFSFLIEQQECVTIESFKHKAYRWGKELVLNLVLLQTAHRISSNNISFEEGAFFLNSILELFKSWSAPPFPLTGEDLLSLGIKEGTRIGALLKDVETWWISQNFPDRKACLAQLSTLL